MLPRPIGLSRSFSSGDAEGPLAGHTLAARPGYNKYGRYFRESCSGCWAYAGAYQSGEIHKRDAERYIKNCIWKLAGEITRRQETQDRNAALLNRAGIPPTDNFSTVPNNIIGRDGMPQQIGWRRWADHQHTLDMFNLTLDNCEQALFSLDVVPPTPAPLAPIREASLEEGEIPGNNSSRSRSRSRRSRSRSRRSRSRSRGRGRSRSRRSRSPQRCGKRKTRCKHKYRRGSKTRKNN